MSHSIESIRLNILELQRSVRATDEVIDSLKKQKHGLDQDADKIKKEMSHSDLSALNKRAITIDKQVKRKKIELEIDILRFKLISLSISKDNLIEVERLSKKEHKKFVFLTLLFRLSFMPLILAITAKIMFFLFWTEITALSFNLTAALIFTLVGTVVLCLIFFLYICAYPFFLEKIEKYFDGKIYFLGSLYNIYYNPNIEKDLSDKLSNQDIRNDLKINRFYYESPLRESEFKIKEISKYNGINFDERKFRIDCRIRETEEDLAKKTIELHGCDQCESTINISLSQLYDSKKSITDEMNNAGWRSSNLYKKNKDIEDVENKIAIETNKKNNLLKEIKNFEQDIAYLKGNINSDFEDQLDFDTRRKWSLLEVDLKAMESVIMSQAKVDTYKLQQIQDMQRKAQKRKHEDLERLMNKLQRLRLEM